jgi:type VI secretion system secreted protein VgrG
MPSSTALRFQLKIGALPPDKFRVLEFTQTEAMSECFRLHIEAGSEDPDIPYAEMIGKDAHLTVAGDDFAVKHHGVVTAFNQYPDASENFGQESYLYEIAIEPRLKLLSYTHQSRIFLKQSFQEIVAEVLKGGGLAADDFDLKIKGSPRKREYTVQYNETDLDFLSRLWEDEGCYYWFDHAGDKEKLIIADSVEGVATVPHTPAVEYLAGSGLSHLATQNEQRDHIAKLRRTQRMVTGKALIKDYNDRTPATAVLGRAGKTAGQGEDYHYGPQALDAGEAARIATLRAEMHAAVKIKLEGEGICRAFRAGMRFELKDSHGHSHLAGKYTLLRVVHHGDQREGFEGDEAKIIYKNNFECIPADTVFRPALATPKPKIAGFLSAKTDGVEGQYAFLDDDGRYHAKLPFDLTDKKDGRASLPIRMNQPYGGPNYGMHFPVHVGNEIVLAFEDGDPDRPMALGTVPNPSTASPVNKRNPSESIIRTATGHQIRLDDKEGKTLIDLHTAGRHLLALNDTPASQQVLIKTSGGHTFVLDDSGKNITLKSTGGHSVKIDDTAKSITVVTAGGHELHMDDPGKSISLKDGQGVNSITLDGGGKMLHLASTGDVKIDAGKSILMTAKESFTVEAGKDMTLSADGAGAISVKKGMTVDVTQDLATQAKKIAFTADTDFKAAAKKIDLKAESDFKVDSGKANIKASGDVILKGSKVSAN